MGPSDIGRIVTLFALAIATSLDSLGVGVAYGLSQTRVRIPAHICISTVMMAITWASVEMGSRIARYMSASAAHMMSAVFFAGLGLWILKPLCFKGRKPAADASPGHTPSILEVIDKPELADIDHSRDIDLREALLLGVALSINNIGGGVSAGLIHLNAFSMAALSVFFNVVCIVGGLVIGTRLGTTRLSGYAQALSGITLILVGLYQLK